MRELRDHLSRYLERVAGGEEVVVTDHGRAIARIVAFGAERKLDALIASGAVTPARHQARHRPEPVPGRGTVSDLVADQRR